jgi:spermidine synthase
MRDSRPLVQRNWLSRAAIHAALLFSGAAALVYETSWTRMLHRVFGVGDVAVATILAAFFLGLGLGSYLASRYADRIRKPGHVYARIEIVIAVLALVSPFVVPILGRAYGAIGPDAGIGVLSAWRLGLALAVLLPPTVLMGATLPVLATIAAPRGDWARGVTALYVTNTLGAMLGAGLAGFYLIPFLGGRVSTWIAAAASAAAAAIVFAVHRGARTAPHEAPKSEAREAEAGEAKVESGGSALLAISLAACTGASALAGEVLWTRVLRGLLQATTQAFAAMLVNYLFGIAIGALIARRIAKGRMGPAWGLGVTQVLAGVLSIVAMLAAPHIGRIVSLVRGEPSFMPHEPSVALFASTLLLLPLALVLGTGLPLAWGLAERVDPDAARGSGKLLAANTMGGLAGSILAGFVLVPALGIEASIFAVVFVHLIAAGLALRHATKDRTPIARSLALTAPLVMGVALMLARPSLELPFILGAWQRPIDAIVRGPDGSWRDSLVFLAEGRSATVTVSRGEGSLRLFNDGRPESGFATGGPGFGSELAMLGGAPVLFAERTDRALVIGLGAGHTTTVLLAGGFRRVDVVELEEQIVNAARLMHEARSDPFPLDDPRAHLIVDDARNRLALAPPRSYDAVVSQPSHPWLAGSSALYTAEFFEEVDRVLTPGGVFSLWLNLFRIRPAHVRAVVRTLAREFPHVQAFIVDRSSIVFCASRRPFAWGPRWDERFERLRPRYFQHYGIPDRVAFLGTLEIEPAAMRAFGGEGDAIIDDRPLLEFELARTSPDAWVSPAHIDRIVRGVPWWSRGFARGLGRDVRADALVSRIAVAVHRPAALRRVESSLGQVELDASDRAYVEGALAEARGDLQRALRAWDRSARPEAARRADDLRVHEGLARRALEGARDRRVHAAGASALLRAALGVAEPWAFEVALREVERAARPEDRELARFVESYAARRCAAWTEEREAISRLARTESSVALIAQECAFLAGDRQEAERLGTLFVRARRVAAAGAYDLGERCRAGGNRGCARMMLRRALREYPSDSRAASALALVLSEGGRTMDAREVLLAAMRETEGLPESQERLAGTARSLGIDLGDVAPQGGSDRSPSSTSAEPEREGAGRD